MTDATSKTLDTASLTSRLRRFAWPIAWSVALTEIVIGPMASRGWVVLLDWVTGPRMTLSDRIFDGSGLPAGPVFYGVGAVLHGLTGPAVGWLVPALALVVAGVGGAALADALAPDAHASLPARLIAATAALWNPFVHERLYAGQLAVLAGYALLPWLLASTMRGVRRARDGQTTRLTTLRTAILWALAAACSVHFALIGGVAVTAVALAGLVHRGHDGRRPSVKAVAMWWLSVTVVTAVVTLAWIAPIASDAPPKGDARTTQAFATRADPAFGLVGGTLAQHGFWRSSPGEPGSELGWWWSTGVGILGGAALLGLGGTLVGRRRGGNGRAGEASATLGLAAAAVIGWLIGQGPNGLVGGLVTWLADQPGPLGVMREPGKFLALVSMAWVGGLALFVERAARSRYIRSVRGALGAPVRTANGPDVPRKSSWIAPITIVLATGVIAAAPVVLTPGLAWGVGGRLRAVHYPVEWESARSGIAMLAAVDNRPGTIVVLPWKGYVDAGFTNRRITHNAVRAFFGPSAEVSDDADVPGLAPSARTVAVRAALNDPHGSGTLARLGVRFVVAAPGQNAPVLASLRRSGAGTTPSLYEVSNN